MLAGSVVATAIAQTAPITPANGARWPRALQAGQQTMAMQRPEPEVWEHDRLTARSAVVVRSADQPPRYGFVWIEAATSVDPTHRLVMLANAHIVKASFPSRPEQTPAWTAALSSGLPALWSTIPLDQLQSDLAIARAQKVADARPMPDDPPQITFSSSPASLIRVDGEPVYRDVAGTMLQRIVNTSALIVRNPAGIHFLKVRDGWMESYWLTGWWTRSGTVPEDGEEAIRQAVGAKTVDLLIGDPLEDALSGVNPRPRPTAFVFTIPAELIVTDGPLRFTRIDGTPLEYVENTSADVFRDPDGNLYVLASGRWFRASDTSGPWQQVLSGDLPESFTRIPDSCPKARVKASVAGTVEADEAAIADTIPRTVTVKKQAAMLTAPVFDGAPNVQRIDGTDLSYVVNSRTPILSVGAPSEYFAVEKGEWYHATSLGGPWSVASHVPDAIYAIPRSSPLHYVTYVRIDDAAADVVTFGSTPGYDGTVRHDGVVLFGTGYVYAPWVGRDWWSRPLTYGVGAHLALTPQKGWAFAFANAQGVSAQRPPRSGDHDRSGAAGSGRR